MIKNLFSFIEAPVYQGQKHFGVSLGPSFIRQRLIDQQFNFKTQSVVAAQSKILPSFEVYEELSYLTEREVRRKQALFIAGGDHSLSIGSVQGILRAEPDVKVLWVDAHGDINTKKSSLTGAIHGMPLAYLTGAENFNEEWFCERLKPENLIYFGVRDLDKAEKDYLDKNKIAHYSASDVQKNLTQVINEICGQFQNSKIHLSVDADAFDPMLAPSTGVPVENGLNYQQVKQLVTALTIKSEIISYEYVELNPQLFTTTDDVLATAQIGIDLFTEVLKQQKESMYGSHDRFSYPAKSDLLHTHF